LRASDNIIIGNFLYIHPSMVVRMPTDPNGRTNLGKYA
jgi:hypothetical protein